MTLINDTCNYATILTGDNQYYQKCTTIPAKVDISDNAGTTKDNTLAMESSYVMSFLSNGSDNAFPKYVGSAKDDISEFIF